ncbi:TonB C-terminal domain-containing protein, partial [Candidatus Pseudothioglobus singularis]|nr:TonB C-terminal domain-containing protein [Candidatus Pseudothioglobus singularis]
MKKLLLLLLLSLGLIGASYADDSQEAIESEIAAFEAKLEAELAAQEMMTEIVASQAALEAFYQKLIDEKSIGGTKPTYIQYAKRLWVAVIATKVKSYWNYSGANDDWSCNVIVHQNENGKVLTVNIQDCKTGSNALMADDKVRAFMNSIERAVYKASPLPIAP